MLCLRVFMIVYDVGRVFVFYISMSVYDVICSYDMLCISMCVFVDLLFVVVIVHICCKLCCVCALCMYERV